MMVMSSSGTLGSELESVTEDHQMHSCLLYIQRQLLLSFIGIHRYLELTRWNMREGESE